MLTHAFDNTCNNVSNCSVPTLVYTFKVKINFQKGEFYSETVLIYVLIFKTKMAKAIFKLLVPMKKILKGENLTTGPKRYTTTKKSYPYNPCDFSNITPTKYVPRLHPTTSWSLRI